MRHKERFFGIDEMFSEGSEASDEVLRRRRRVQTRYIRPGELRCEDEKDRAGEGLPCPGNVVLQAVFPVPGEGRESGSGADSRQDAQGRRVSGRPFGRGHRPPGDGPEGGSEGLF